MKFGQKFHRHQPSKFVSLPPPKDRHRPTKSVDENKLIKNRIRQLERQKRQIQKGVFVPVAKRSVQHVPTGRKNDVIISTFRMNEK
jgi:hypothetical protein